MSPDDSMIIREGIEVAASVSENGVDIPEADKVGRELPQTPNKEDHKRRHQQTLAGAPATVPTLADQKKHLSHHCRATDTSRFG